MFILYYGHCTTFDVDNEREYKMHKWYCRTAESGIGNRYVRRGLYPLALNKATPRRDGAFNSWLPPGAKLNKHII